MGLDYVDIFYSHRFDPETPVEETMMALDTAVRSGPGAVRRHLVVLRRQDRRGGRAIARDLGTPLLIHQPSYSMLNRWIEPDLLDELERQGMGCIVFSALAQGLLTDRYLDGIPEDSRAARDDSTIAGLDDEVLDRVRVAERDRPAPRPEARPARPPVGAARPAGHLRGDRRVVGRAARHQPRRARLPAADRRRARRDRQARRRVRREPLGQVGPRSQQNRSDRASVRRECPILVHGEGGR